MKEPNYEKFFDSSYIHHIDITIDESDWADLNENAIEESEYHADICIDGDTINNVSISPKGSSSLRNIYIDSDENGNKNRYSLKIKFGKYIDDQTYLGLDILNLNNNYSDPSQMKDYLAYSMFRKMGIPAPLSCYVLVTVNGENYGLLHAVEDVKKGFLNRNYEGQGQLYKPENSQLTKINDDYDEKLQAAMEEGNDIPAQDIKQMLENISPYSNGADLRYTDDDSDSYSEIFDNDKTNSKKDDKKRLINALKNLSQKDIENSVDRDDVMKYFVVHNFTSNYDSYLSKFNHNYYLYENNGILSMIPWDYNYFDVMATDERAAMFHSLTTTHIDIDIDNPLTVPTDSRPMWSWIVDDENSLNQYHSYFDSFLSDCIESGWLIDEINRIDNLIKNELEKDTNMIYTMDEYDTAVADLKAFIDQRSENIRRQLNNI